MHSQMTCSMRREAAGTRARFQGVQIAALLGLVLLTGAGCRSTSANKKTTDTKVERFAEAAHVAYAEGYVDEAIVEYRAAIRRAWAMDDPYESGTAAYNLAACMTSKSRIAEAKDWLLDSRVELYRAGKSAGNTWLLEAKIATQQACFEDACLYVRRASCSKPPCESDPENCLCSPKDPCEDGCGERIPCVGAKIKDKHDAADCKNGYTAQIQLTQARISAEQYDIPSAYRCFCSACDLVKDICDHNLHAELEDVAALIHVAKGEHLQAGCHFDREAKSLRLAGTYREIPGVLELAAAAYEQAGRCDLAADRLCRVARIWYGRGDLKKAWGHVQTALPIAEIANSHAARIRLALLAHEIQQSLDDSGETIAGIEDQPVMLAPPNIVPPVRKASFQQRRAAF